VALSLQHPARANLKHIAQGLEELTVEVSDSSAVSIKPVNRAQADAALRGFRHGVGGHGRLVFRQQLGKSQAHSHMLGHGDTMVKIGNARPHSASSNVTVKPFCSELSIWAPPDHCTHLQAIKVLQDDEGREVGKNLL